MWSTEDYGKAVLDICKNHLLCIFNGRAGTDRLIGNATTTDGSVIDYVIGSPFLLSKIKHFNINDFDSLFSDKHRSIEWFFSNDNAGANSRNNNYKPPQVSNTNSVYWDPNKATDFIANIDRIAIANMIDNFECLSINQITDNIKHILISSAKVSFPKMVTNLTFSYLLEVLDREKICLRFYLVFLLMTSNKSLLSMAENL